MLALFLLALSTFCAVLPMLFFLGLLWWLDRYDREPIWLLSLTFLWGAIGGIGLALVGSSVVLLPVELLAPGVADATGAVLVAPLIEEPAKAVFLLPLLFSKHFDNMTDGFVYGAACGLGFGMTENFLYFANAAMAGDAMTWMMTVVVRVLYSAVMHASASSVVGAALGWARFRGWAFVVAAGVVGLGVAMSIHALWNGLLTLDTAVGLGGAGFGVNLLLFPLEFLFIFGIFHLCLYQEKLVIRRELHEEVEAGLLPEGHATIIGSYCARNSTRWVPPGVDHHRYVSAATTLAFRKQQARLTAGRAGMNNEFYRDEVVRLRKQIRRYLDLAGTAEPSPPDQSGPPELPPNR